MITFIDDHREVYGVEPICRVLPIAPSTYHAHVAQRTDPAKASPRARQDRVLMAQIRQARADGVPTGVVLGDVAYGNETHFRVGVNDLALSYVLQYVDPSPAPTSVS